MSARKLMRKISVPAGSSLTERDYAEFLEQAYLLLAGHAQYLAPDEDINSLELAHLLPSVPETVVAIYTGINDAVCNKGLVSPFLMRHGHNNVFVFEPDVYPGGQDVPAGTVDVEEVVSGFQPPNETWDTSWTYVMIRDPGRTFKSLWQEKGYIDTIPAKFEDFTLLSDGRNSRICFFIDPKAFDHPVNRAREYLSRARQRGLEAADQYRVPQALKPSLEGLVPVLLEKGQKLYVAAADRSPCDHAWSNLHESNRDYAVVNENSAVPLKLIIEKPKVAAKYAGRLRPPGGSADLTTDAFGQPVLRKPLLEGSPHCRWSPKPL